MNVRRVRLARLQMRLMSRVGAFRWAVRGIRDIVGWQGWDNLLVRAAVLALALPVIWLIISTTKEELLMRLDYWRYQRREKH